MNPIGEPSFRADRRYFLRTSAVGSLAGFLHGVRGEEPEMLVAESSFGGICRNLLRDWCDGMLKVRIHKPSDPGLHGALDCPACGIIHGRCMDAVYPFLHMAKTTGQEKYLDAGISVFEWSKNVSQEDGSWTVIRDPKSWKGISVFGAIALAEALDRHGDLLDAATRQRWLDRLGRAGDYLYQTITAIDFANINYGSSAIFAFGLLGRVLNRPAYSQRSQDLISGIRQFLTKPNGLLFGEGRPANGTSPRGCRPVDLGYNVEESLVALAMAAKAGNDAELSGLVVRLLEAHLEFMLPDGAWDNSWGTRQAKWTYWGSRTSDGCQPAFALFAEGRPSFASAVVKNTLLYRSCTQEGLLHGGPHYVRHGLKPCVHHTFTHAKALASLCDQGDLVNHLRATAPLPRATADGIRSYPEIATWLLARGPWRATVTAADTIYQKVAQQPTGGVLSMLWNSRVGPLFAGSMARYHRVEPYNMQLPLESQDHPLTPRIELWQDQTWFTQLYDLNAEVDASDKNGEIRVEVRGRLLDEERREPFRGKPDFRLIYQFDDDRLLITANAAGAGEPNARPQMVLPLVSQSEEVVHQAAAGRIEVRKPDGLLVIEANLPLRILTLPRARIFNLVPGFEAIPITAEIPPGLQLECSIRVIPS